jgi:hypothetical protein
VAVPAFDRLRCDAECFGDFVDGEPAFVAEALVVAGDVAAWQSARSRVAVNGLPRPVACRASTPTPPQAPSARVAGADQRKRSHPDAKVAAGPAECGLSLDELRASSRAVDAIPLLVLRILLRLEFP